MISVKDKQEDRLSRLNIGIQSRPFYFLVGVSLDKADL